MPSTLPQTYKSAHARGGHAYTFTEGSGSQTSMGSASGAYRDMRAIIFVIALS